MALQSITGNFTLARGETLSATNDTALYVRPTDSAQRGPLVVIDGTVNVDGSSQSSFGGVTAIIVENGAQLFEGGVFMPTGALTVGATGVIRVSSTGGAGAVNGPNLTNHGLIDVQARTTAGVFYTSMNGLFVNTGTIRVDGGEGARTVRMDNNSAFDNSGTIEVIGGNEATFGFESYRFDAAFVNSGTLKVSDRGVARDCIAVTISGSNDEGGSFLNSGRIEGDIALRFSVGANFFKPLQTGKVVNTGVMVGRVEMNGGRMELVNSGRIEGAVTLGISDDIYDGRGGRLTQTLHAGAGGDSLLGGDSADPLAGDAGDDTILGGGGNDTLEGGEGADLLDGGAGADVVSFAAAAAGVTVDLAAGSATGEGADRLAGFEAVIGSVWGDVLQGSAAAETLSGGSGHDTLEGRGGGDVLSGGAGGDTFRIGPGAGAGRVTDFNAADGDRVEVAAGSSFTLSQQGADTVVDLGGGTRLILVGVNRATLPEGAVGTGPTTGPRPPGVPQESSTIMVTTAAYVLPEESSLVVRDQTGIVFNPSGAVLPTITLAGQLAVEGGAASLLGATLAGLSVGNSGFNATTVTVMAGGALRVDTSAGFATAKGVDAPFWAPRVINNGMIEALSRRDAYGVYSGGTSEQREFAVANTGTIRVVSSEANAWGVYLPSADWVSNAGGIEVSAARKAIGVYYFQWDGALTNTGVIRAVDGNPDEDSVAVWFQSSLSQGRFLNAGLLEGDIALKVVSHNGPSNENASFNPMETFENTGRMIGKVDLGFQRQLLLNSGSIEGDVSLGSADDVYDGRAGSIVGMVSGGDGADSLAGGALFDSLQGNQGNDTASGGLGDDWVVGGKDNDLLFGDAGADLVYGNLGNDTCEGGDGDDIVRGGQNDDVINGGAGDDYVSGDKGNDTVAGGAGADRFHTFGDAGLDRVLDFSIADGDRVQLDPGTQYTVAQTGADTVISMAGSGQMILVGVQMSALPDGWIFGA